MSLLTREMIAGSSPLARGLRGDHRLALSKFRIIPARAGFTSEHGFPVNARRDHPRSRGVYPSPVYISTWSVGSSPLARGLHVFELSLVVGLGIIPARAGFTWIVN